MISLETIIENTAFNPSNCGLAGDKIVAHPARAAMSQSLAGKGELVFEGELLEFPLKWHPAGTRH